MLYVQSTTNFSNLTGDNSKNAPITKQETKIANKVFFH